MYCASEGDGYCWRCMGDLYRRLGLKNVGLASQKLTSVFLNKSLKAFHDSTMKTSKIDWSNCLYDVK